MYTIDNRNKDNSFVSSLFAKSVNNNLRVPRLSDTPWKISTKRQSVQIVLPIHVTCGKGFVVSHQTEYKEEEIN